ncbi:MAG: amidohydrolase [SAR202 cluster bacterium]|nr:amidohydrolase [SAR202 cluster bacterium]
MIIDSHVHVWTKDTAKFPMDGKLPEADASAETLIKLQQEAGVDKAVIVQPRNYMWDNSYVADCVKRFPERFTAIALIDPASPEGPATLEKLYKKQGFTGVRLQLGWAKDPKENSDKNRDPFWKKAGELGAVLGLLGSGLDHSCVEPIIERHQNVKVVLDHLAGLSIEEQAPYMNRNSVMRLVKYPNVYVKVSLLHNKSKQDYPYKDTFALTKALYETYGPQRLMWGTDFPSVMAKCGVAKSIETVKQMDFLSASDKEWLFHKTSEKVWSWHGPKGAGKKK